MKSHFLGLRTVIIPAADLKEVKTWYTKALGVKPYFDEPFYVGFNIGGYELGLDPDAPKATGKGGSKTYWGVKNIEVTLAHLTDLGAKAGDNIENVGEGIKVATVFDPFGNELGLIENPHFSLDA